MRLIKPRLALIGDAAHVVHPLGGQGLNLGLRDAELLANAIADARALGQDIGSVNALNPYARASVAANAPMMAALDGLQKLFANDTYPVALARSLGLAAVNATGPFAERSLGTPWAARERAFILNPNHQLVDASRLRRRLAMRAEPDDDPSSRAPSTSTPDAWTRWLTVANAELAREGVARALRPVQPRRRRIDQSDANDAAATCDARESTLERWRTNDDDLGESCDGAGTSRALRVFSGNDYLGLGEHARTRRAAANAAAAYGCGPRSSALVCGYTDMHRALERELARICETEECVLFPSGFAANATTLPAACGSEDCCIFSDALNHASIVDGCRLARQGGATVRTFAHRDYDELERELKTCSAKRTAVVSDSLFSMDGDYADVERLASLKRKYGFLLILDEAHATLVCGERGGWRGAGARVDAPTSTCTSER